MASKERGTCVGVEKYVGFGLNAHAKLGDKKPGEEEYSAREVNKIEHIVEGVGKI